MTRKRIQLALFVAVLGLALPSVASACQRCTLYRICTGDDCWWTSLCTLPSAPVAGWAECDDTSVPCFTGGPKCQWVLAPELKKGSPDAPAAGA
jgi:hypothetical protein